MSARQCATASLLRRTVAALTLSLSALTAAGQAHGPGAHMPGALPNKSASRLYTPQDLHFLTHMIVHHAQALDMAALVPARSGRAEFIRFARHVDGAQRAEIDLMKSLLRAARERGLAIPPDPDGDPPMHGMLSSAQMTALTEARGPQFERLWLEGMIDHHQGALDMARAQQEHQFETLRSPHGIDVLVDDILVVQRAEINKMRAWLDEWGLAGQ